MRLGQLQRDQPAVEGQWVVARAAIEDQEIERTYDCVSRDEFVRSLEAGVMSAGRKSPGIRDVARRAQVSTATVSRVLNGIATVQPALRWAVEEAARELGYQPDRVARSLRIGGSSTLGLMLPDAHNALFMEIVRGVQAVTNAEGLLVMVCDADQDTARERQYSRLLAGERVAGVLAAPRDPSGASLQPLIDCGIPVVVFDRKPKGLDVDSVVLDDRMGAHLCVRHLVKAGRKKIAIVTGPLEVSVALERLVGFKEAMTEARFHINPDWVRVGTFEESSGYENMLALLALSSPPDAVIASNNVITLGAMRAIRDRGLRVPGEISLVAFDEMPWSSLTDPPLTTVSLPAYEMGVAATEALMSRLRKPDLPRQNLVLEPRLVARGSTPSDRSVQSTDGSPAFG